MPPTFANTTRIVSPNSWHPCVYIALSPITQKQEEQGLETPSCPGPLGSAPFLLGMAEQPFLKILRPLVGLG